MLSLPYCFLISLSTLWVPEFLRGDFGAVTHFAIVLIIGSSFVHYLLSKNDKLRCIRVHDDDDVRAISLTLLNCGFEVKPVGKCFLYRKRFLWKIWTAHLLRTEHNGNLLFVPNFLFEKIRDSAKNLEELDIDFPYTARNPKSSSRRLLSILRRAFFTIYFATFFWLSAIRAYDYISELKYELLPYIARFGIGLYLINTVSTCLIDLLRSKNNYVRINTNRNIAEVFYLCLKNRYEAEYISGGVYIFNIASTLTSPYSYLVNKQPIILEETDHKISITGPKNLFKDLT
jgi:hypothetical protein